MRAGKGSAGKLMTDDKLYAELTRFTTTAADVTKTIARARAASASSSTTRSIAKLAAGFADESRRDDAAHQCRPGQLGKAG